MSFHKFCQGHGLVIRHLVVSGEWQRVPTTDHPNKTNGAYIYDGKYGACQNWATMESPARYKNEGPVDEVKWRQLHEKIDEEKKSRQAAAARKAGWIMHQCELAEHPYLAKKGFSGEMGNVYDGKLVIPMRIDNVMAGVQLIDAQGEKRFLFGQRTKMATHQIGNRGLNVVCEGYATGLSVKHALKFSGMPFQVHVCFSAGNMVEVAKTLKAGLCMADNDQSETGERAAKAIGWPYWIWKDIGDFNDYAQGKSPFALGQELKKIIMGIT